MWNIFLFLLRHPLTRRHLAAALGRVLAYQIATRTRRETVLPWVGNTKLAVRRHMKGASGNIYAGLHEYADMGFLIHSLREDDLFIDIGANIGSWTVLGSGLCGARTIAIEPDASTAALLRRNIEVNGITNLVQIKQLALADREGSIPFTIGLDTTNRLATLHDANVQQVPCARLDSLVAAHPTLIKIDVEGAEELVFRGGQETLRSPTLLAVLTESNAVAVKDMLNDAGFTRAFYDPATRTLSTEDNQAPANNALFVRDFAACQRRVEQAPFRHIVGNRL